jgi:hypothetical protein
MEDRIDHLEAENATLRLKMVSLEATEEQDVSRLACDIAYDRQRLAKLETREERPAPTATETDRIERIEKLCTDAPGHTISLSEIRGRLGIDKSVLSRLLKKIDREKFFLRKASHDKRVRYLWLRPVVR